MTDDQVRATLIKIITILNSATMARTIPQDLRAHWPDHFQQPELAYGYNVATVLRRPIPTAAEVDELDRWLPLIFALKRELRWPVVERAKTTRSGNQLPWHEVGRRCGCAANTARHREAMGIHRIVILLREKKIAQNLIAK